VPVRLLHMLDKFRGPVRAGKPKRSEIACSRAVLDCLVVSAQDRLERADEVADHVFRARREGARQAALRPAANAARPRKICAPCGLSVPARDARKAMRDVSISISSGEGSRRSSLRPDKHALPRARFAVSQEKAIADFASRSVDVAARFRLETRGFRHFESSSWR
jgi:hypothetical protein